MSSQTNKGVRHLWCRQYLIGAVFLGLVSAGIGYADDKNEPAYKDPNYRIVYSDLFDQWDFLDENTLTWSLKFVPVLKVTLSELTKRTPVLIKEPIGNHPDAGKGSEELNEAVGVQYPILPSTRPEWIDQPKRLVGAEPTWPIHSLAVDAKEHQEELTREARKATRKYIRHLVGITDSSLSDQRIDHLFMLDDGDDGIVKQLMDSGWPEYQGTVKFRNRSMVEKAVMLRFDPSFSKQILAVWHNHQVSRRITTVACFGGGGILLLGLCSGVLNAANRRRSI